MKQKDGEDRNAFIGRCMASPEMIKQYPTAERRLEVCYAKLNPNIDNEYGDYIG
jgi:hypothetical protein